MTHDTDAALAAAARHLTGDHGAALISEAGQLFESRVPSHNALNRLAALALNHLGLDAARQAGILAWMQASLRARALEKLGDAVGGGVLFDSDGLQMSSGLEAATYHADILQRAGFRSVIDMTAGIGIDSIAFAQSGLDIIAYERNPARAALLAANVKRLGLDSKIAVRQADSTADNAPSAGEFEHACIFLDPPRREGAVRWGNAELADSMFSQAKARGAGGILMKLSPAVELDYGLKNEADLEFISVRGECREALLIWGKIRLDDSAPPNVSAIMLPQGETMSAAAGASHRAAVVSEIEAARFLYEPDAAVIRAGLTGELAVSRALLQIDSDVAYLVSQSMVEMPFAVAYRILDSFPYHRKLVQSWLDARGATQLVVKKRGIPDDPEAVRRSFKLKPASRSSSPAPAILALTRRGKQRWALFLERI